MRQDRKTKKVISHLYFSGPPGDNTSKITHHRLTGKLKKVLTDLMTRNLPPASSISDATDLFVTFYAVCKDQKPNDAANLRRLAAMLIYRSHSNISGTLETGYSYDGRPDAVAAYYKLLHLLMIPGNVGSVIQEAISASDGASVEEIADYSSRKADGRRTGA